MWRPAIADTLTINSVEEELRGPQRCRKSWRTRCAASRHVRQRRRRLHRMLPSDEVAQAVSLLRFPRWKQKRGHDVNLVCLCELRSEPSLYMYFIPFCFTQQENPERTRDDCSSCCFILIIYLFFKLYYASTSLFVCFRTSEEVASVRLR